MHTKTDADAGTAPDEIAVPAEVPTPSTGPGADCCPRTTPHRHLDDERVLATPT